MKSHLQKVKDGLIKVEKMREEKHTIKSAQRNQGSTQRNLKKEEREYRKLSLEERIYKIEVDPKKQLGEETKEKLQKIIQDNKEIFGSHLP